jgi:signal transduction histidine kinase
MMIEDAKSLTSKEIEEMGVTILASALRLKTSLEKFILYSSLHYELNDLKNNNSLKYNVVENLEDIIQNAVAGEKNYTSGIIDLETEIEKGRIKINEAYFTICVKELVENAFKFSDPDTKVKISGKNKTDYYELSFENKGAWLTSDQIKKINVLNKQFDPTLPGSGLGLPIVKKIIKFFGGKLKVASGPNKITTVTVKLQTTDNNN